MLLTRVISTTYKYASTHTLARSIFFKNYSNTALKDEKSYDEIPGPKNFYQFFVQFLPGGKYHDLPLNKLIERFRSDFGNLTKFPGFLGQKPMVITFLPEDFEKMHRQEGRYPHRRNMDSFAYFRNKHRPDLYPAGAGLVVT